MYHRSIGDESNNVEIAEKIRKLLSRAIVLGVILAAAPYLYNYMTKEDLTGIFGGDPLVWETIQWSILVVIVFMILGLVGVARCTRDT